MKYILNKMNKYVYLKSFITLMCLGVLLLRGFSISIESHYIQIFILIVIVTPLQKKYE